jgi:hypothetical protein
VSRDFICPSCTDYLIAYHPLWLNPELLPGPSLLDLVARREFPLLSSDLAQIEWETPRSDPSARDAVRLVDLLGLDDRTHPAIAVGDADLLHRFLREGRRSPPVNADERDALARVYRYLATSDWMPIHLASEYRLRADTLARPTKATVEETAIIEEPMEETAPAPSAPDLPPPETEPEEALPELPPMDVEPAEDEVALPAPEPYRPEPCRFRSRQNLCLSPNRSRRRRPATWRSGPNSRR